jgi:hypothetical protein
MAIVALATAPVLAQDTAAPETTELDPITVTAPAAPLDRSLNLLRLLVAQSAPCLGCDAVLAPVQPPATARLLGYLLASEPPAVSQHDLLLLDIKLKDSPDLEYLRP